MARTFEIAKKTRSTGTGKLHHLSHRNVRSLHIQRDTILSNKWELSKGKRTIAVRQQCCPFEMPAHITIGIKYMIMILIRISTWIRTLFRLRRPQQTKVDDVKNTAVRSKPYAFEKRSGNLKKTLESFTIQNMEIQLRLQLESKLGSLLDWYCMKLNQFREFDQMIVLHRILALWYKIQIQKTFSDINCDGTKWHAKRRKES